jgi:hypothetical protein
MGGSFQKPDGTTFKYQIKISHQKRFKSIWIKKQSDAKNCHNQHLPQKNYLTKNTQTFSQFSFKLIHIYFRFKIQEFILWIIMKG